MTMGARPDADLTPDAAQADGERVTPAGNPRQDLISLICAIALAITMVICMVLMVVG